MSELLENYSAVLIAALVGTFVVLNGLMVTKLLAPRRKTRLKGQVYECGMLPIGRNWVQVHVRYYIFAILFLVFDVEIIFLFPWATSFLGLTDSVGRFVLWEMILFIGILGIGLGYAWRKGVLEWQKGTVER